ncbi:hypothetical protein FB451DRAFT_1401252 [Mycena latifolia]|nr:hypothetical protein FB451DRAFT_1401252 [Mycena latifolia]
MDSVATSQPLHDGDSEEHLCGHIYLPEGTSLRLGNDTLEDFERVRSSQPLEDDDWQTYGVLKVPLAMSPPTTPMRQSITPADATPSVIAIRARRARLVRRWYVVFDETEATPCSYTGYNLAALQSCQARYYEQLEAQWLQLRSRSHPSGPSTSLRSNGRAAARPDVPPAHAQLAFSPPVLATIYTGQLTIEPMSSSALLSESSSNSGTNSNTGPNNSRSAAVLKTTVTYTSTSGSPTSAPRSLSRPLHEHSAPYPPQIYIVRIAAPLPPPQPMNPPMRFASPSPFLPSVGPPPRRRRFTRCARPGGASHACTLWAFVRTGVVERLWEEEVPMLLPPPPRRHGLWVMTSKLGERAVNWSGEGSKEKEQEKKAEEEGLPTPPPMHPTISAPSRSSTPAPPLLKRSEGAARSHLPRRPKQPAAPAPVHAFKADDVKRKRFSAHQAPPPDSRPGTPAASVPTIAPSDVAPAAPTPTPGAAPPPLPRCAAARAVRPVPPPPEAPSEYTSETPAVASAEQATGGDEAPKAVEAAVEKVADADVSSPPVEAAPVEAAAEGPAPAPQEAAAEKSRKRKRRILMSHASTPLSPREEKAEDTKEEEDEREAYVGDVTWEEWTWKELVRLREDMFWARIGGIRW